MQQVAWIIEDVFNKKDTNRLVEACKNTATPYSILSTKDVLLKDESGNLYDHHPIIAYGSMSFMNAIHKTSLLPGSWIDYDATQCHKYLPILKSFSIHHTYGFHTLDQILTDSKRLFKLYGKRLFIKPDISTKAFSGQIIDSDTVNEFVASSIHLSEDILCLVSVPRQKDIIINEYRFFVTKEKIITATQYQPETSNNVPTKFHDFVNRVRRHYFHFANLRFPYEHPISIDVGELINGEIKLVEIGGFNCAGLYDIDYVALVNECNRCALQEWKQYE